VDVNTDGARSLRGLEVAPSREHNLGSLARSGARDVLDGMHQWRMWYLIGSAEMRRRYARSKLGQFWIMLSSAITISIMGLVWSYLWKQPVQEMLPFVAVGMVVWQLLAGVISDSTSILPTNGHYFLNQYTPASTILMSLIYRQGATFLLNLMFPITLALAFGTPITVSMLLAVPGLILLGLTVFWMAFVISILCARFRDLIQLVNSVLQVAIFLTPVLWKPDLLPPEAHSLMIWNPLAVLLTIVRDPLLGRVVPLEFWAAALFIAIGGFLISLPFIGRYRRRFIYWL